MGIKQIMIFRQKYQFYEDALRKIAYIWHLKWKRGRRFIIGLAGDIEFSGIFFENHCFYRLLT